MAIEVFLPKMSDNMDVGVIVGWLVREGERVEKGQPILELETDKATVQLEAPESGVLKGIRPGVDTGASVSVGTTIAFIAGAIDEAVPTLSPLVAGPAGAGLQVVETDSPRGSKVSEVSNRTDEAVRAAPAARRIARELHIDLRNVKGTGPGGRVTEADVRAFRESQRPGDAPLAPLLPPNARDTIRVTPVAPRMAARMGVDFDQVGLHNNRGRLAKADLLAHLDSAEKAQPAPGEDGEVEWLELTRAQVMTGRRMAESIQTAPQFALSTTVDMSQALRLREALSPQVQTESGAHISITAILVKIVADTLSRYPRANASFHEGRVMLLKQVNIGVAVGTEQGLVVPVIHDADKKTLPGLAKELALLQEKAGAMRFAPSDLSGGTFTISNLGMFGVDRFHAIVNPPESAILAVGRIVRALAVMPDDSLALRPMMDITLSIDHRSLDGMQGAAFLAMVKKGLEQPDMLV